MLPILLDLPNMILDSGLLVPQGLLIVEHHKGLFVLAIMSFV